MIRATVPRIKAKYEHAARGRYVTLEDGKMFFRSGKNVVHIREHFPGAGAAPEKLLENTIRYERENLSKAVEKQESLCYNDEVNNVL